MNGSEVALAAIALAATMGGAVIWVAKYFAKELSEDLKQHTKAAVQQQQASLKSAQASDRLREVVEIVGKNSQEQYKFMKALNGKLAKATIQTVQEQKVEHQTVKKGING